MGTDFLDKTRGTYTKGWDRGYQELAEKDLFTISPKSVRTILVRPSDPAIFGSDVLYELQEKDGMILVYKDAQIAGVCESPAVSVLNQLNAIGGKALGTLNQVRERSGLVDLAVSFGGADE